MMRRKKEALVGHAASLAWNAHPRVFELLRASGAGVIHRLPLALVRPVPQLQAALAGGHTALLGGAEPTLQASTGARSGAGGGERAGGGILERCMRGALVPSACAAAVVAVGPGWGCRQCQRAAMQLDRRRAATPPQYAHHYRNRMLPLTRLL